MQYFHISGLKQVWDNKHEKVDLLITADDQTNLRNIMKPYWIVVLSIKEYNDSISSFWPVSFSFYYEWVLINWVTKIEKVRDAYLLLSSYWFDISYINNLLTPITDWEVELILTKLKKELEELRSNKWLDAKSWWKYWLYDKKYSEKDLIKIKEIVNLTISDFEILKQKVWDTISLTEIKEAEDIVGELKKYRQWSNLEKLSYMLDSLLSVMEKLEIKFLDISKKNETENYSWAVISDLDFVLEFEKYKKSSKRSKMWTLIKTERTIDDHYYSIFWKAWIYIKFLWKEAAAKLSNYSLIINNSFIILELIFIFLLIEFTLYYLYNLLIWNDMISIYYYIWNIWLLWIIFFLIKLTKSKNQLFNILLIFFWFAIFFLISKLLFNTFAL